MIDRLVAPPRLNLKEPEFYAEANCKESKAHQRIIDLESEGRNIDSDTLIEARAMCMGCVVMSECVEYGLQIPSEFGMYGGMPQRQRRALSKDLGVKPIKRPFVRGRKT